MHTTITNSLAKNINMRGVNGKIGLQRLQLRDVVIGKLALMPIVSFICLRIQKLFKLIFWVLREEKTGEYKMRN